MLFIMHKPRGGGIHAFIFYILSKIATESERGRTEKIQQLSGLSIFINSSSVMPFEPEYCIILWLGHHIIQKYNEKYWWTKSHYQVTS